LPAKLALLLCERIDRSMDLLLSNDDRNFELWARHARAALLLNRPDEEAVQLAKSQLMPLLVEFFKVDNVATLPFASKLRNDMLAWAVERLIALYELDGELAQRIRGQLGTGDISVAYQLVEFQRRYNAESDDAALPSRRKRFSFIWDDWADKTADVPTPRQPGAVAMSDAFKYLAAYKILVGNPSIAMLAQLCGGTPVETRILLQERFPAGASLLWANAGQVVFGHDSLADQYFFLNPKVPLQVCLEYLLDTASLDDESVVDFARAAFSPALIHHHQLIPAGVDLDRLLRCFTAQPSLMQVMVDEQKLYKVELARVYLDAVRASERGVDVVADARYGQALGESFRRLIDRGQEPVINLWNRYFLAALGICEQLPQPMVGYACETTETRCAVTSRLSKIRRSIGNWNWVGEDDRWRELVFAESLLSRFVQLDPADRIGCFEWVMTLRELGRYQEARQAAHDHILDVDPAGEAADVDVSLLCNVRHTVIESYSDELKELGKAGGSYYKRRDLEQHIRVEYEALIAQARAAGLEADGYVQKFARFEKDTKQFQHAYSLLQDLPDSERKMLELGMLYSSSNLKFDSRAHKLFNLDKAIACYVKAWHFQQERRNVKAREKLSILYPLASALFQDRRLADASQVCHYALCFKREKKVLDLLAKLGEDDKRRNELPDILR
ncbi:MAG: hypothetical protein IJJ14_04365, partial [Coriobacteriales bacterium]|nr:hypothetical protein [Coriobacteriales bacterium]